MIKAVFFDVDGLLINSEVVYLDCWMRAVDSLGFTMTKDMALDMRSLDSTLAREQFIKWFGIDIYDAAREKRKELMNVYNETHIMEAKLGVKEAVEFANANGLAIYVVTASPVDRARKYLDRAGIGQFFDNIISTKTVSRGKPFPDVYKLAADTAGVSPSECIAFEDSPNGLKSAKSAGCITVMVPDQTGLNEDLRPYVDYCINNLSEATDTIKIL